MTSATNERAIRAARAQAKRDLANEAILFHKIMADVPGRKWVWEFLSAAQLFQEDATLDPQGLAYSKGKRVMGMSILRAAQRHTPQAFILMMQENTGVTLEVEQEEEDA